MMLTERLEVVLVVQSRSDRGGFVAALRKLYPLDWATQQATPTRCDVTSLPKQVHTHNRPQTHRGRYTLAWREAGRGPPGKPAHDGHSGDGDGDGSQTLRESGAHQIEVDSCADEEEEPTSEWDETAKHISQ
jgi:hypothetical protein